MIPAASVGRPVLGSSPTAPANGGRRDALEVELYDGSDTAWIARVIDIAEASLGQTWRTFVERLEVAGLRVPARRIAAIVRALRVVGGGRLERARIARTARTATLGLPALDPQTREARIAAAASSLGIAVEDVETVLWADLAMERPVLLPRGRPREADLAAIANLDRIQQTLRRAHDVELTVWDNAHELVRAAKRYGLLASVSRRGDATVLRVTGPLSLFHATTIYGNALAALAPVLVDHERFELEVRCRMRSGERHLRAASPLLLPTERAVRRPGYRVAQRLARGLEALGCTVESEPPALASGEDLLFPDLVVEHAGVRALVEIIGFSTEDYLGHRLAQYREAGAGIVILCVDATRAGDGEPTDDSDHRILRYARGPRPTNRRPLDPAAVIEALEALR